MANTKLPDEERFIRKIAKTGVGCWEWTGARDRDGYGKFGSGISQYAHRFSHWWFIGPIPDGYEVDHLCRNRGCVNPAHLEAVTRQVNVERSDAGGHYRNRSHCKNGHEFTAENTRIRTSGGRFVQRVCRTCHRGQANA